MQLTTLLVLTSCLLSLVQAHQPPMGPLALLYFYPFLPLIHLWDNIYDARRNFWKAAADLRNRNRTSIRPHGRFARDIRLNRLPDWQINQEDPVDE